LLKAEKVRERSGVRLTKFADKKATNDDHLGAIVYSRNKIRNEIESPKQHMTTALYSTRPFFCGGVMPYPTHTAWIISESGKIEDASRNILRRCAAT
jgi:hypothetical protein